MLKSSLSYPYPMLRSESIDYKQDFLNVDLDLQTSENGYEAKIDISTSNKNINDLLEKGFAIKGVIIKSSSTWYRKFFKLNTGENFIFISSKEVYGKVDILPCIVAIKNIEKFYSNDFSEEFKSIDIMINEGELLAVGDEYSFDALLESDIFKNTSSIFEFIKGEQKQLTYNLEEDKIIISLPEDIKNKYSNLVNAMASPKSILNNSLVFPVLVSVLYDMKENEDFWEDKKWFKTIMKTIEVKNSNKSISGLSIDGKIENPLDIAQSLTNGLLSTALDDIENIIIGNSFGEE